MSVMFELHELTNNLKHTIKQLSIKHKIKMNYSSLDKYSNEIILCILSLIQQSNFILCDGKVGKLEIWHVLTEKDGNVLSLMISFPADGFKENEHSSPVMITKINPSKYFSYAYDFGKPLPLFSIMRNEKNKLVAKQI